MFMYDVMSEQEAIEERFHLLKEGEYEGIVLSSQDKTSASSGNPMMDMIIQVFDENGKAREVRDFLVFTKSMMWKVIHFSNSAGLLKEYEEGSLCSDVAEACRLKVRVSIEEGKPIPPEKLNGKPNGSKYPDKNKIEDYIKKDDQIKSDAHINENAIEDSDIPF